MNALWRETAYAFRSLRRQPLFALPVILALALGIGANVTIFSVLNSVVLHPQVLDAWRDPDRVISIRENNRYLSSIFANRLPARAITWQALRSRGMKSFSRLAAWRESSALLRMNGRSERISTGEATPDLLPLMGVQPRIGRAFSASDVRPGPGQVALISEELFRRRFEKDGISGQTISLDGRRVAIIGVLPSHVAFPEPNTDEKRPDVWLPLSLNTQPKDETFSLLVYGRLKEGTSAAAALAELRVFDAQRPREHNLNDGFSLNATPLVESATDGDTRRQLLILQIAVAFVLLIACANAGNLLLTRTAARNRDLAIRVSLGAGSARLMRESFIESAILTVAGAVGGVLFWFGTIKVLPAIAPAGFEALQNLGPDRTVLLFSVAATLFTAIVFGLAPAIYSRGSSVGQALNTSSRTATRGSDGMRKTLAVLEVAMSLVLIVGAGLMVRSLVALAQTGIGFDLDRLLVMRLNLPAPAYDAAPKLSHFNTQLLEAIRGVSGVESAALTTGMPLKSVSQSTFTIPGEPADPKHLRVTNWARVSGGYFETLGLRRIAGRTLTPHDAQTAAVVNQAFVAAHFPNETPLGKLVEFSDENNVNTTWRIAGVVSNERQMGPDNEQAPELYLPASHLRDFLLVARTAGEPTQLANAFRAAVARLDSNIEVAEIMSERAALDQWLAPRRFNMIVLLAFAGIALFLSATGLYSVIAYSVALRTREIGIRVAVGATPFRIRAHILRDGLKLSIAGIIIGAGAALGLTRCMESLIYGVEPVDPLTFVSVTALVLLLAIAASYLPAVRAARIDPVEALRAE